MPHYKTIICPFSQFCSKQKGQWKSSITCENIRDNMGFELKNAIKFESSQEMDEYMEMYCANQDYQDCEYCKVILRKYEGKK